MAAKKRTIPKRRDTTLYIGAWLKRLNVRQVELARAASITEGYLSELISGRKTNPTFNVLSDIADHLGITPDDLRRPPPDIQAIEAMSGLNPATIDRLTRQTRR